MSAQVGMCAVILHERTQYHALPPILLGSRRIISSILRIIQAWSSWSFHFCILLLHVRYFYLYLQSIFLKTWILCKIIKNRKRQMLLGLLTMFTRIHHEY